jgi:hypothetical protein
MPHLALSLSLCLAGALCLPAGRAAEPDVASRIGAGNIERRDPATRLDLLRQLGAGHCRIPISSNDYWKGGKPTTDRPAELVLAALKRGIRPVILFEYYTRWSGELGGREKWHAIGRAYAEQFRPGSEFLESRGIRKRGVVHFTAINEPMWKSNNPQPIPVDAYVAAMQGLAAGVHSVDLTLKVSPGGFQEVPLFMNKNNYLPALAPLYNSGALQSIDIHRYWDVKHVPMNHDRKWSLACQFKEAKRRAGITRDIAFHTTEMNFKKRLVDENAAAKGLLTALWDALTVTGNNGQPVTGFIMPWNIFHTAGRDEHYGMCHSLDPWKPTARGKVIQSLCELTRGLHIESTAPETTGLTRLSDDKRLLIVWQNRKGWTDRPGKQLRLEDLPTGASRLRIHTWKGLLREVSLPGKLQFTATDLPLEQTIMFEIE